MTVPWITMLATSHEQLPSPKSVMDSMKEIPWCTGIEFTLLDETSEHFTFRASGDISSPFTCAVSLAHDILNFQKLKAPCSRCWYWPEAAFAFAQMKSQLMCAVQGETSSPLLAAQVLTALTAAVILSTDTLGVYWNSGDLVHDPEAFLPRAREMTADIFPLELWIDFRVKRSIHGIMMGTWGMTPFGVCDLETFSSTRTLPWLLSWMHNLSLYVLHHAAEIENEHTVGSSEDEKFTIRYESSQMGHDTEVLRVYFDPEE